jgi:aminopeptidase N
MEPLIGGAPLFPVRRWSSALSVALALGLCPILPAGAQATPADPTPAVSSVDDPTPAATPVDSPAPAPEPAAVSTLRSALTAGDLSALQALIINAKSPLALWLTERVQGQLSGRAAVARWEIALSPLFAAVADMGQLRVTAVLASGETMATEAPVRLLPGDRLEALASIGALSLPISGHTLQVKLDPATGGLAVTDTMATQAPSGRTYVMKLSPQLTVATVIRGPKPVPFERQGDHLVLRIPAGAPLVPLQIRYGGTWQPGPYDFITARSVLLRPESNWYPRSVGPASPMTFVTTVQAPGLTVLSTGQPGKGGAWQPARPVNGVAVTAGRFVTSSRKVGTTTIQVCLSQASAPYAKVILDEAAKVLAFATSKLGAYPFPTLTIAESDVAGGYGGEAFVSLGSRVVANRRARSTFLAHEIWHSWTDRLLGRGTEGEIGFLSEALTTYLAYQYVATLPGAEPALLRQAMTLDYSRYHGQPGDVSVREAQAAAGTGPWFGVVYQKGAMVFHDLYRHVGDQRFWTVIKGLYAAYSGKPVGLQDMRQVAERVAGEPLDWWFAQWTERGGAPRLALTSVQTERLEGGRYRLSGRVTQTGGVYRLKVPVVVRTSAGLEQFNLSLLRDDQPFAVTVPAVPQSLQLDPDYQIVSSRRRPPTLATTKLDDVTIVVGTQSPDPDERQAADDLAKALAAPLQSAGGKVSIVPDTAATAEQLAEAPTVFLIGRPGLNAWTGRVTFLPVAMNQDRFTVAGTTYERPTQGIVQTLAGVWRRGQVVTVFGGLGAPALRQMAVLKLGQAPLEVVVSGEPRIVEAASYGLADPELSVRLRAAEGS